MWVDAHSGSVVRITTAIMEENQQEVEVLAGHKHEARSEGPVHDSARYARFGNSYIIHDDCTSHNGGNACGAEHYNR